MLCPSCQIELYHPAPGSLCPACRKPVRAETPVSIPVGGMARLLSGLLIATGLLYLVTFLARNTGAVNALSSLMVIVAIGTACVFIAWFHRIRFNAGLWQQQSWRLGWAIGGWFVPVLFVWIPYRIAIDAWRTAFGPLAASRWLVRAWWWCWLVTWVASLRIAKAGQAVRYDLHPGSTLPSVVALLAAGVLAAWMVLRLSEAQDLRGRPELRPAEVKVS